MFEILDCRPHRRCIPNFFLDCKVSAQIMVTSFIPVVQILRQNSTILACCKMHTPNTVPFDPNFETGMQVTNMGTRYSRNWLYKTNLTPVKSSGMNTGMRKRCKTLKLGSCMW